MFRIIWYIDEELLRVCLEYFSSFAKCSGIREHEVFCQQCWVLTGLPCKGTSIFQNVYHMCMNMCLWTCSFSYIRSGRDIISAWPDVTDLSLMHFCRCLGTKWEDQGQTALLLPQGTKGKSILQFYTLWLHIGYV